MDNVPDFYCKICESHMNSESMWDSHINGKKHLKKVKNSGGVEADFSRKNLEEPTVETEKNGDNWKTKEKSDSNKKTRHSKMADTLESHSEPIVGLDYVCELQYSDTSIHPTYNCRLCNATLGVMGIIEHVTSTKHRLNYIKKNDSEGHMIMESMQDEKVPIDGLALERTATLEKKHGRGTMEVKLEKSKFGSLAQLRKRPQNYPDDIVSMKKSNMDNLGTDEIHDNRTNEFIGRIPFLDINSKLHIIEEMSDVMITKDSEAKDLLNVITTLNQLLMQYKIQHLVPDLQETFTRKLPSEDTRLSDLYSRPMGYPGLPAAYSTAVPMQHREPMPMVRPETMPMARREPIPFGHLELPMPMGRPELPMSMGRPEVPMPMRRPELPKPMRQPELSVGYPKPVSMNPYQNFRTFGVNNFSSRF